MGRKKTDQVIEHRISFSDLERKQIQSIIDTQKTNVAVDGVTATLQAAGSALAGGGMLWAAVGLVAWFGGGGLIGGLKKSGNLYWNMFKEVVDPFGLNRPEASFDVEKWRAINAEDERRLELAQADLDRYANPASQYYDESKIAAAHAALLHAIELRDTNNQLEFEERERIRTLYTRLGVIDEGVYSPNELALIYAYEEAYRAWEECGEVGFEPTLDLSRAN